MRQIDLFSGAAEPAQAAQPTQRQQAPEKPLLSTTERRVFDITMDHLTPAEIERATAYAAKQRGRLEAWMSGKDASVVRLGARKMTAELVATLKLLLPLCVGPAEKEPVSSVQAKSEAPAPRKRGRPPTIARARSEKELGRDESAPVKPHKAVREDNPPRPNDRTAAAVPPPKVKLAPEQVLAIRPPKPPRRASVEA